jgi:hypothetical protein
MTPAVSQVKERKNLHPVVASPLQIQINPAFYPSAPRPEITIFRAVVLATSDQSFAVFSPQPPLASLRACHGPAQKMRRIVSPLETNFTKPCD